MTSDLLPPPNLGLALGLGAAAAVAGAAAWAAVIVFANSEIGWLAVGIGALVGFAMVKAGGHGQMLAICAAVLAVLSIGTGKHFAYQHAISTTLDDLAGNIDGMFGKVQTDADAWAALGGSPSDEQVSAFALDHGYEVEDAAEFRREWAPDLAWIHTNKPSAEQWREYKRAALEERLTNEVGFVDYLKQKFHLFDLLFVGLGVAAAFSLVQRHTQALQVAARQQLRAEREAEEAAKAPEEGDN
ncbi:MAG: hypothetical protein R3F29_01230 [Planctomycetota bacterium]